MGINFNLPTVQKFLTLLEVGFFLVELFLSSFFFSLGFCEQCFSLVFSFFDYFKGFFFRFDELFFDGELNGSFFS